MLSPLALIHASDGSRKLAESALPQSATCASTGADLLRELRVALDANLDRLPEGSSERELLANDLVARVLGPERRVA